VMPFSTIALMSFSVTLLAEPTRDLIEIVRARQTDASRCH
jgi:hypothetical protein